MRDNHIRVFLVERDELVRAALVSMLSRYEGLAIVGSALTTEEAAERLTETGADVVVVDHSRRRREGHTMCRELMEKQQPAHVVALSAHLDREMVQSAFLAGARGYVVKDVDPTNLVRALRYTGARFYVDPQVAHAVLGWL